MLAPVRRPECVKIICSEHDLNDQVGGSGYPHDVSTDTTSV